jgi:predicted phage terminase large subunit-like protein
MNLHESAIRPQPGPQEAFLSTPADIAIYGGAAFGGKSFALLLESVRHSDNPKFGAVIFRRTTKMIRAEGGLWDTAEELFTELQAKPNISQLAWTFPGGAKVSFAHLEHESNKFDWQGAQVALLGFDELTHFTASQFWYLISRNRSGSGVAGYVRATTNPDPDSWVADLIAWWIDQETGYAIPERSGVVRWFIRYRNELIWADSKEELLEQFPDLSPKSLTFIASSFRDNQIGLAKDPTYMASLDALPEVERERLKFGNWKIKPAAGDYFKEIWFEVIERLPSEPLVWVRYWDRAATEPSASNPDPDYTVGCLVGKDRERGIYYVADMVRERKNPGGVLELIKGTARVDGKGCTVALEHDPAQAGKAEMAMYTRELAGFDVQGIPKTTAKEAAWRPASAQCRAGNIKVLRAPWNKAFFNELENLPKGAHDDIGDSLAGAVNFLELNNVQPAAGATVGTPEEVREAYKPQGGMHPFRRMATLLGLGVRGGR